MGLHATVASDRLSMRVKVRCKKKFIRRGQLHITVTVKHDSGVYAEIVSMSTMCNNHTLFT